MSSQATGHRCWSIMRAVTLLSLALLGSTCACSTSTSYEAGIVCRITKSALLVCKCLPISVQGAFSRDVCCGQKPASIGAGLHPGSLGARVERGGGGREGGRKR